MAYLIYLAFFVLAVLAWSYGYLVFGRFKWIAARETLDLSHPGHYELEFAAQMTSEHSLVLATERNLDPQEQRDRLGITAPVAGEAAKYPQVCKILWSVWHEGAMIASGNSRESTSATWGNTIDKILGSFLATKGAAYQVRIEIAEPDAALAPARPEIRIAMNRAAHKNALVRAGIANRAAKMLFGAGAVIAAILVLYDTLAG